MIETTTNSAYLRRKIKIVLCKYIYIYIKMKILPVQEEPKLNYNLEVLLK